MCQLKLNDSNENLPHCHHEQVTSAWQWQCVTEQFDISNMNILHQTWTLSRLERKTSRYDIAPTRLNYFGGKTRLAIYSLLSSLLTVYLSALLVISHLIFFSCSYSISVHLYLTRTNRILRIAWKLIILYYIGTSVYGLYINVSVDLKEYAELKYEKIYLPTYLDNNYSKYYKL